MIIEIKVIANAPKNSITEENGIFKVRIAAPAVDGKANKKLIEFIAEHFGVKKSCVFIKTGARSKHKLVVINK